MPADGPGVIARGADRPVAELPPAPAGDPFRRRRGAGGPPARAGRGADRRGARHRRGVPGRGQAHGRPRRAVPRVRARALGPALEAARGVPHDRDEPQTASRTDAVVAFGLAVAAALAIKVPALFGMDLGTRQLLPRNIGLFVLPLLTGYFAWKRALDRRTIGGWRWRSSRRPCSPTSIRSTRTAPRRRSPRCTCRSPCGSSP